MDLIAALSSQFGIDAGAARGLAGAALGLVDKQVSHALGASEASELRASIPELSSWKSDGDALAARPAGGLLQAAGSLLGGAGKLGGASGLDVAALIQLAGKAGVPASTAQSLLPLLLQFLQSRVSPELLDKVLRVVPALKPGGSGGGGGLLGALGSILGG
jgi:hypothetical protein